jgi:phosphopantothenoylcysteine decarboxylase/phosphopantothenate--cysteine ligase
VTLIRHDGIEQWPDLAKEEVAERLAGLIADRLRLG